MGDLSVVMGVLPPHGSIPPLPAMSVSLGLSAGVVPTSSVPSSTVAATNVLASTRSVMSLLLPQAEGVANSSKQSKIWIGDGLPAIPKRLHDWMINWEFVDLAELKPAGVLESLHPEPDPQRYIILPGLEVARARKKPIEEIGRWIQCFAIYMAVMARKHPKAIPEMLAYMLSIMRAQQEYEEPAWSRYDEAFREKVAAIGNRKWSQIDTHIYNQVFTGRAKKRPICAGCGSTSHDSSVCPEGHGQGKKFIGTSQQGVRAVARSLVPNSGICYDFNNKGECSYGAMCKYCHMCLQCSGRHPACHCQKGWRSAGRKPFAASKPGGEMRK